MGILLKLGILDNIKITYLEPKDYLGRSGKGLITSLGLKTIARSNKIKKSSFVITNVIMKDLSNIIKKFKILPCNGHVRKRPKHKPTDSYSYIAIYISKFMMRYDAFNSHVDPVRTEMTFVQHIPISHLFGSYKRK